MTLFEKRSRARAATASSAPTFSWPRKLPSGAAVAGLPVSWKSAASRTTSSGGVSATVSRVWP